MLFYVDRFCSCLCLQVERFALFYVDICAFPCLHVDRFMQLCNVFYVVIFNPDVYFIYSILMYILWLAKRYSILITQFTCIIDRAWTLWIYQYIIISGRYTAIKQWKLYIINKKTATCPYIIGILIINPIFK